MTQNLEAQGLSTFEAYHVVAQELLNLPISEKQLTPNELRRKITYLNVLEYIENNCLFPPICSVLDGATVKNSTNTTCMKSASKPQACEEDGNDKAAVARIYGLGSGSSLSVPREKLETLLDTLHERYRLSQAELLQISDLAPRYLVDLYAIIERCPQRYSEEQVSEMARLISETFMPSTTSTLDVIMEEPSLVVEDDASTEQPELSIGAPALATTSPSTG